MSESSLLWTMSILKHEHPPNDHDDWLLDDSAIMRNIIQQQIMEL